MSFVRAFVLESKSGPDWVYPFWIQGKGISCFVLFCRGWGGDGCVDETRQFERLELEDYVSLEVAIHAQYMHGTWRREIESHMVNLDTGWKDMIKKLTVQHKDSHLLLATAARAGGCC